jgi:sulfite reductase alpha subunit-like flavoprotein
MAICPNCGQKASGDYCECCKYPILRGSSTRRREAEKQAKKEAEVAAKEKAKREAEEARKARETEKQAKKEAELAAKEKAKREAEEARKARETEKQAKKEAELAAKEKAKREAEEARKARETREAALDISSEIYEGDVRLVVPSAVTLKHVTQFQEHLRKVDNLKIALVGGSVDEGVIIVVSLEQPVTLIRILNEMPMVEKVDKKGRNIVITLKTPVVS